MEPGLFHQCPMTGLEAVSETQKIQPEYQERLLL